MGKNSKAESFNKNTQMKKDNFFEQIKMELTMRDRSKS